VQRFRGKLGGRQGTFVLQGQEIVENGKIKAKWFVVPGSGIGDLSGLRAERPLDSGVHSRVYLEAVWSRPVFRSDEYPHKPG
jgi:hypothetical protein